MAARRNDSQATLALSATAICPLASGLALVGGGRPGVRADGHGRDDLEGRHDGRVKCGLVRHNSYTIPPDRAFPTLRGTAPDVFNPRLVACLVTGRGRPPRSGQPANREKEQNEANNQAHVRFQPRCFPLGFGRKTANRGGGSGCRKTQATGQALPGSANTYRRCLHGKELRPEQRLRRANTVRRERHIRGFA